MRFLTPSRPRSVDCNHCRTWDNGGSFHPLYLPLTHTGTMLNSAKNNVAIFLSLLLCCSNRPHGIGTPQSGGRSSAPPTALLRLRELAPRHSTNGRVPSSCRGCLRKSAWSPPFRRRTPRKRAQTWPERQQNCVRWESLRNCQDSPPLWLLASTRARGRDEEPYPILALRRLSGRLLLPGGSSS